MDATTTIEVELSNPANNFFIKKQYSYGEITICFLLILIFGVKLWDILLRITNDKNV